ncbi:hypothetical protein DEU56DRAFT_869105 [Suillus clintonianus]|uniref:uncharacterized protein n=1 Tax=Suillus clintonianus TaxID=1904413 RepID=UPI001B879E49|nr:uncharacterized protein DEU56DRAFT_869105 [Suillus clintonianus]KAG2150764.1 hypothetical protein DEU56DRAFT_869105 [Suillus clintonianus]
MVNRRISNNLKDCALRLWNHGWELADICEAFGVSERSCYRWRRIFEECALLMAIEDLFTVYSDLFLDEVCTWLAVSHDIVVSTSTLSRNLKEAGLTCKILRKLASERDEARREEFKASLRNDFIGDGSEFVVIDETSKNDRTYARHYGRAPRGHRAQLTDVFVQGDRIGYIAAHVVEGSLNSREFYDFIAEDVLPHMSPFPGERSIIVLDNCRIHHSEDLVDLVESAGLFLSLFLPL